MARGQLRHLTALIKLLRSHGVTYYRQGETELKLEAARPAGAATAAGDDSVPETFEELLFAHEKAAPKV